MARTEREERAPARDRLKVSLDTLQALAIIGGAVFACFTFWSKLHEPYDQKQLDLYLEASRVTAALAAGPASREERTKFEARFWELYYGELAFVESRVADEKMDSRGNRIKSVEALMVDFCYAYFDPNTKCTGEDRKLGAALALSQKASDEIKRKWDWWLWYFGKS